MKYLALPAVLAALQASTAAAAAALMPAGNQDYPAHVVAKNYTDAEGTLLQGFLALPDHHRRRAAEDDHADEGHHDDGMGTGDEHHEAKGPVPAVVFVHDADGASTYEQQRASIIAHDHGYVGFAADIFGLFTERPPADAPWSERGQFIGQFTGNATLFVQRIQAAVEYVQAMDEVDENKVAIIGYCMGGTGVVHYLNNRGELVEDTTLAGALAESMPQLAGAISVHPSLSTDGPGPSGRIAIPSLFLTGGSDSLTSPESMAKLEADMAVGTAETDTPWETVRYAYIDHAFSNWFSEGRYDARADARSWHASMTFLQEEFGLSHYDEMSPPPGPEEDAMMVVYEDKMDDDFELHGYLRIPDGVTEETEPLPVVIILPHSMDENGPDAYEQKRATEIANEHGYIAMVADVYSQDMEGKSEDELQEMYHADTTKYVSRVRAAIDKVKSDVSGSGGADPEKIALLGFGFGGAGALYYTLLGEVDAGVQAVASFHGELDEVVDATSYLIPEPAAEPSWGTRRVEGHVSKPQILVQSGAGDDETDTAIQMEKILIGAGAQYEMTRFSDAEPMFTDWSEAGYDARASARSFDQLKTVLEEAFGPVSIPAVDGTADPPAAAPHDDDHDHGDGDGHVDMDPPPAPTPASAASSFAAASMGSMCVMGLGLLLQWHL